ncbi:MAG TPA: cytochrome c [Chitinophagaceae bacterium]|nr:cytochrome c [Chitinophagaceae bacterium]
MQKNPEVPSGNSLNMTRLCIVLCTLILFACNPAKQPPRILNSSLLPSAVFSVQPGKDTTLNTPKGARITIRAGTFAKAVQLEIKEAYSMADMLLAGLATESDGMPLQSDGMIYINTVDKETVDVQLPIRISMPGSGTRDMKLYTGVERNDGSINWASPVDISIINRDTPHIGRRMFWKLCATCHGINGATSGPDLAGSMKRAPDSATFYEFVRNNPKVLAKRDPYYTALYNQYNKLPMNLFPELRDVDIDQIMQYVEWAKKNAPNDTMVITRSDTSQPVNNFVDMYRDTAAIPETEDTIYDRSSEKMSIEEYEALLRSGSVTTSYTDEYEFTITTLGWFNIDEGMQGLPGTVLCDLKVKVIPDTPQQAILTVYLFIPSRKNMSIGAGPLEDGLYHFDKLQGKIPLFLNEKAFVLVWGNDGKQMYYGITAFTIQQLQTVGVKLLKTTQANFLKQVKALKFEGMQYELQQVTDR